MLALISRAAQAFPDTPRSLELKQVVIVCMVFSWFGVLLRCFTRAYIVRAFTFDDWLFVGSLVVNTTNMAIGYHTIVIGLGQHIVDLPIDARVQVFRWLYINEQFYTAASTSVKVAFGFFYLRILSEPWVHRADPQFSRKASRVLYGLIILSILFAIAYGMVFVFQCWPISHMWTQFAGSKGACIDQQIIVAGTYIHSTINALLDLSFALLPVPVLWRMQVSRRTKLSVILILGVGCIPCISTFVRFKYVPTINFNTDATWTFEKLALWSTVEIGAALFASGLVVSKPLINLIVDRIKVMESYDHPDKLIINVQVEEKTFEFDKSDASSVLGHNAPRRSPPGTVDGTHSRRKGSTVAVSAHPPPGSSGDIGCASGSTAIPPDSRLQKMS